MYCKEQNLFWPGSSLGILGCNLKTSAGSNKRPDSEVTALNSGSYPISFSTLETVAPR